MKKMSLSFDMGGSHIKIAKREKGKISVHSVQMPENLIKDGVVQVPHMLSDFLKELKEEYKFPKGECGIVVPDDVVVCRHLTLPAMTEDQLKVNLPFEFADYITEEPQSYFYDYAVQDMVYDENNKPKEMNLVAAAMSKETIDSYISIFNNAGLKLRTIIPHEVAMANIVKNAVEKGKLKKEEESCIIDLGHRTTQVYIFKGEELCVVRNIHLGTSLIDKAIAEYENIDEFLARTHKNMNYNNVLDEDCCRTAYGSIAVEIMKVINFYRYSNRTSSLQNIYLVGGGSNIKQLSMAIADTTEMNSKSFVELLTDVADGNVDVSGLNAIGVMMQ